MKKEQANVNFIDIEHQMLDKWNKEDLFHQIVEKNKNGKRFRFLDGPMTANNRCGVHHIWGRTLKDITIKYNAMKGKSCHYQNGFDAQGMWVEVNVEKELGLNGKPEIVNYGIDKFTNKCIERVNYYANEITNQSIRMGQFMDWENSYFTNSDSNITAIWAFLKKCNEKGWIVKKNRPMAWCPRCGTSLSEHEMAGSYHDVVHTAIFVKLPVINKDFKMVAWTTTPWTLSANVALAVNPDLTYVKVLQKSTGDKLVLGKDALKVLKDDAQVLEEFSGKELVGLTYETCFPELSEQNFVHRVVAWDQVDSTEGSCVVHIAPGCGEEDFELGLKENLPQICPINEQGIMLENTGFLANKKTTDVVDLVIERLNNDKKLVYAHKYKHSYPFCWRCKTDLVYKLISTWYIKMDDLRPQLLKAIDTVEFQPEYAKKRMIDWLNNMGDWNISRSRFYGLPLPIYVCEKCGKVHVIGSKEELREKAVDKTLVDKLPHIHRPWIDDIKIKCDCGNVVSRIPEVGDCWLDAGITPFSTKKYFTDKKFFEENFPSEYVCEMIEQIKLWFYSLLVMSVVLTGKAPYEKVITYQYVRDENGNEFHKSGGNSLECDVVADKVGAETIRYLYAGANPTNDMRFGYSLTDEARRKIMAFWNIYFFFNTYAVIDNPKLDGYKPDFENMDITDKWLIAKTNEFIQNSDKNYSEYKYYNVVKDFEVFVDDISNFYIRVNRKRFWKSSSLDQLNAYYSLYQAIKSVIRVMAPIMPFITDYIWQNMVKQIETKEVDSVHLSSFPTKLDYDNASLIDEVEKAREIIYLAQKLRNEHNLKVKQPLNTMYIKCSVDYKKAVEVMKDNVLEELNIKNIEFVEDDEKFNSQRLALNFRKAGQVLKGDINKVKEILQNMPDKEMKQLVLDVKDGKNINIDNFNNLQPDLFEVKLTPKQEFAVANLGNNLVVLDIELTEELINEGYLRELIRALQVCRKEANFDITDRILLDISTKEERLNKVLTESKEIIKNEVLVKQICNIEKPEIEKQIMIDGLSVNVKMARN